VHQNPTRNPDIFPSLKTGASKNKPQNDGVRKLNTQSVNFDPTLLNVAAGIKRLHCEQDFVSM
jgi:hypothetical protein